VIINGGEKMPIPLIERIQRTFPSAWFADAYGLTETVSGDTFLDRDSIITKLGSVGRPCLHLELDIWDEQGQSVPAGELVTRPAPDPPMFTVSGSTCTNVAVIDTLAPQITTWHVLPIL